MTIPETPVPGICSNCRKPIRSRQSGTWEEVLGWRKAGTRQGALREARSTGRVLCAGCLPGDLPGKGELLFDV